MFEIGKKRILVTLVLSIFILFFTGLIQAFDREEWNFLFLGGTSCTVTGYPIKVCFRNASSGLLLSISLVNLFFWFAVINILYSLKQIKVGLLAVTIWIISMIIHMQTARCIDKPSWYKITGYPIAECVSGDGKIAVFTVYLVNIAFWFLVIKLLQRTFVWIKSRVT